MASSEGMAGIFSNGAHVHQGFMAALQRAWTHGASAAGEARVAHQQAGSARPRDLGAFLGQFGGQHGGIVTAEGIVPIQGFQAGGIVGKKGLPPGPKDSVPAMLQIGELVIPKKLVDATKKNAKEIAVSLSGEVGKGYKKVIDDSKKFVKDHHKQIDTLRTNALKTTTQFRKDTIDDFQNTSKQGTSLTQRMKSNVTDALGRMRQGGTAQSSSMKKGVTGDFQSMDSAVSKAISKLASMTNKALKALGVKPVQFGVADSGGGKGSGKQTGGMVVPGQGSGDKVPLRAMVEPGERVFVLNRNASAHLAQLQDLNKRIPRFATGGALDDPEGKRGRGNRFYGPPGFHEPKWPHSRGNVWKHFKVWYQHHHQEGGRALLGTEKHWWHWYRHRWHLTHPGGGYVQRGGLVPHLAKGGMAAMIAEADRIDKHHYPYVLGGGHSGFGMQPFDCSGAVSDVLHAAGLLNVPMVTTQLEHWGKPGKGPLTVFVNDAHTVMSLDGRVFGTSSAFNPGGGAGWIDEVHGNGAALAPGMTRTMDVGGAIVGAIKKVLLEGAKGPVLDMGQASVTKIRAAANALIARKTPSGTFGGGNANVGKGVLSRDDMRKLIHAHNMKDIMGWVSYAESGWDPNTGNGSYEGLWAEGAPFWSQYGGKKFGPWPAMAHDPNAAATVAQTGYQALGLQPWYASKYEGGGGGWAHLSSINPGPFKKGGLLPYLGKFHDGGGVPHDGLGLLKGGEAVVPAMKDGGVTPFAELPNIKALINAIGLAAFGPHAQRRLDYLKDKGHLSADQKKELEALKERKKEHQLELKLLRQGGGPGALGRILKAMKKYGPTFSASDRKRERLLGHIAKGLSKHQRAELKHLKGLNHLSTKQHKELKHLRLIQQGLSKEQHRELMHLHREQRRAHREHAAEQTIANRRSLEKELLAEFKGLRADEKQRHADLLNLRASVSLLRALSGSVGAQLGVQSRAKSRNAAVPGTAGSF